MSLSRDLLEQAELLARKEPTRPRQASLRRAISTAYYALFHLLLEEASREVARESVSIMQPLIMRSLNHGDMKKVARSFASGYGGLASELQTRFSNPLPTDLSLVADIFVQLQQSRHDADYNVERRFTRRGTARLVADARAAFAAWERIRRSNDARQFLLCLLLADRWKR